MTAKYNKTLNITRAEVGSEWFAATGTFKASLPQVPECQPNEAARFRSAKELSKFVRAKLAKQAKRAA